MTTEQTQPEAPREAGFAHKNPTMREYRGLEREVETLREEIKALRSGLIALSQPGIGIDQVTGLPLEMIHLGVTGMGKVNIDTVLAEMADGNEESEVDIYCIAEGAYRVLREYNIPAFGYESEEIPERLGKLHEEIQNGLGRVLHVWRQCGAWDGQRWQDWHKHVPAYRVMRNHNWGAAE